MDKCPVDHSQLDRQSHPYFNNKPTTRTDLNDPDHQRKDHSSLAKQENGDDSQLNPLNYMPNDLGSHRNNLSTDREYSSIPRHVPDDEQGQKQVWVYPSQQMFFNAMKRKQWDPKEQDMKVVVPIHNAVNEMAWKKILEWESYATETCLPQLSQFKGEPGKLSPKAWAKSTLLGYTKPFDRHDWQVNRCGTEINYVIDFYSGRRPLNDHSSVAFYLDVRPKLDTYEGFKLRLTRFFSDLIH